jgi:hypothetical protein
MVNIETWRRKIMQCNEYSGMGAEDKDQSGDKPTGNGKTT